MHGQSIVYPSVGHGWKLCRTHPSLSLRNLRLQLTVESGSMLRFCKHHDTTPDTYTNLKILHVESYVHMYADFAVIAPYRTVYTNALIPTDPLPTTPPDLLLTTPPDLLPSSIDG